MRFKLISIGCGIMTVQLMGASLAWCAPEEYSASEPTWFSHSANVCWKFPQDRLIWFRPWRDILLQDLLWTYGIIGRSRSEVHGLIGLPDVVQGTIESYEIKSERAAEYLQYDYRAGVAYRWRLS